MVSVPETGEVKVSPTPVTAGENVTFTVQLAAGATLVQLFVCANCAETEMLLIVTVLPPVLVTVTVIAGEVVPIDWPPTSSVVGLTKSAPGDEGVVRQALLTARDGSTYPVNFGTPRWLCNIVFTADKTHASQSAYP